MNKGDFLTVNEEINNHNILAERTYKTFKRMEKAGELVERKSGFYQPFHDYLFKSVIYEKNGKHSNGGRIRKYKKRN